MVLLLAPLAWAMLAQAPASTLSGVVVDPAGRPIAGAEVWLVDRPWWDGPKGLGSGSARADAEGRFSIAGVGRPRGGGPDMPLGLWAYAPGHRLGLVAFPADLPGPDEVVRVEVGPPARAVFRFESPDPSKPIKGKVEVYSVHRRPGSLPRPLIERLGAPIGLDGIAVLDGLTPEDVQGFDARTELHGTQSRDDYQPVAGDRTIRLRAAGHLSGKVAGADPAKLKGWKIDASTHPDDDPNGSGLYGHYWADTDDQGRFDFPTLPAGELTIQAQPPKDARYLIVHVKGRRVEAGATLEVEVPARPGILVEGSVREAGTGAPMPGVWISLFPETDFVGGASERTDEAGHYSKVLSPGSLTIHASGGPPTHLLPPGTTGRKFDIPAGVGRFELPTIEMTRGDTVRGIVVDAKGNPVAGAAVEVRYPGDAEGDLTRSRAKTWTPTARGPSSSRGSPPRPRSRCRRRRGATRPPETSRPAPIPGNPSA